MFELRRRVSVPPYCGVPSLSHQLPVALAVAVVVVVLGMVMGVDVAFEVGWDVVDAVDVEIVVVVDLAQDAETSDATMRHVRIIQIVPFFIEPPFK